MPRHFEGRQNSSALPFIEEALRRGGTEGGDAVEDAGRRWRRIVPSHLPVGVIQHDAIKDLIDSDFIAISVGGDGICVVENEDGNLEGVAAVIDKDYANSLLAASIDAVLPLISTAMEKLALKFGKPDQRWIDHMTDAKAKQHAATSHFA